MLDIIFGKVVEVTLASSVVIFLLLILSKALARSFTAKWRYWVWLIIAIRLALPVNLTLVSPPVQLPATEIITQLIELLPAQDTSGQTGADSTPTIEPDSAGVENPDVTADPLNNRPVRLADLLRMIWLTGSLLFVVWHVILYVLFLRRIRFSCKAVRQQDLLSLYHGICCEMRIKRPKPLLTSSLVSGPLVLGIWQQQLILPDMAFTPPQMGMILRHELVHIRRRDICYKVLILLVRAIHWFNPLVHLMASEACKAVEASCDTAVVADQDIEFRKDYGKTIFLIINNSRSAQVAFSTHFGGGKNMTLNRLDNLFDMRSKRKGTWLTVLVILIMGITGLCVSCSPRSGATILETQAVNDLRLLGKWIEAVPADIVGLPVDSIEFCQDGTAVIADQHHGTYQTADLKLTCTFYHETYKGKYEVNATKLTIFKDDGESKTYLKLESLTGIDPQLLGKWVEEIPQDIVGLPVNSIEFFVDGSAVIADQYHGTYQTVGVVLHCQFNADEYAGKYEIEGTKLTIHSDDGQSKVYLKSKPG